MDVYQRLCGLILPADHNTKHLSFSKLSRPRTPCGHVAEGMEPQRTPVGVKSDPEPCRGSSSDAQVGDP